MVSRRRERLIKDIARESMYLLFDESLKALRRGDKELARRYIEIMTRLSMKARVRLRRDIRRRVCKRCGIPLVPGLTSSVRVRGRGKRLLLVVRCLECGHVKRYQLRPGTS